MVCATVCTCVTADLLLGVLPFYRLLKRPLVLVVGGEVVSCGGTGAGVGYVDLSACWDSFARVWRKDLCVCGLGWYDIDA